MLFSCLEVQQRIIVGHTAAVNCFLYPFEENQRYDPELFLSGGMDFAVIVWDIVTGSKVHRFCAQGGPVLRIVVPPENCNVIFLLCINRLIIILMSLASNSKLCVCNCWR
jgi:WD40 repeat protein